MHAASDVCVALIETQWNDINNSTHWWCVCQHSALDRAETEKDRDTVERHQQLNSLTMCLSTQCSWQSRDWEGSRHSGTTSTTQHTDDVSVNTVLLTLNFPPHLCTTAHYPKCIQLSARKYEQYFTCKQKFKLNFGDGSSVVLNITEACSTLHHQQVNQLAVSHCQFTCTQFLQTC